MKVLLINLLILVTFSSSYCQVAGSVIIDFNSNFPLSSVIISTGNAALTKTDKSGEFDISKISISDNVLIDLIGFHRTYIDTYSLSISDTIYLFSYKSTMTEKESKFRQNKNIKDGKILLEKHNLNYEYTYNESKQTLNLKVTNAR